MELNLERVNNILPPAFLIPVEVQCEQNIPVGCVPPTFVVPGVWVWSWGGGYGPGGYGRKALHPSL